MARGLKVRETFQPDLDCLGFSIALQPAKMKRSHDRYSDGLHHLAFHMDSREDVDQFYAYLQKHDIEVLDKTG